MVEIEQNLITYNATVSTIINSRVEFSGTDIQCKKLSDIYGEVTTQPHNDNIATQKTFFVLKNTFFFFSAQFSAQLSCIKSAVAAMDAANPPANAASAVPSSALIVCHTPADSASEMKNDSIHAVASASLNVAP